MASSSSRRGSAQAVPYRRSTEVIILDTNVVSELMKGREGDADVMTFDAVHHDSPYALTTLSIAEIQAGIAMMTEGRRKRGVTQAFEAILREDIQHILPFDRDAAMCYGALFALRTQAGLPPAPLDTLIASIALLHGAPVATRNVSDFAQMGVDIINPFDFG